MAQSMSLIEQVQKNLYNQLSDPKGNGVEQDNFTTQCVTIQGNPLDPFFSNSATEIKICEDSRFKNHFALSIFGTELSSVDTPSNIISSKTIAFEKKLEKQLPKHCSIDQFDYLDDNVIVQYSCEYNKNIMAKTIPELSRELSLFIQETQGKMENDFVL